MPKKSDEDAGTSWISKKTDEAKDLISNVSRVKTNVVFQSSLTYGYDEQYGVPPLWNLRILAHEAIVHVRGAYWPHDE